MTATNRAFWEDRVEDLKDPQLLRSFIVESVRIVTVDVIVNALEGARGAAGLSKAALARAIGARPDAIRRLLTADSANPTVSTVAEIAAALGMRLALEPLSAAERKQITEPLVSGEHRNPGALAAHLQTMREPRSRPKRASDPLRG